MQSAFIGRQPIYREGVEVMGYELFSKNSEAEHHAFCNGDTVTAEAVLQEYLDVGIARLMKPQTAFINVTKGFVLNDYAWFLPKSDVVLQLAGDMPTDERLMKSLFHLGHHGYKIAVDNPAEGSPIAEHADFVKLDISNSDRDGLSRRVGSFKSQDVKVVASGVNTVDDYEFCKQAGFDYFEGYHFCKPQCSDTGSLPSNRLSTLSLLSTLHNPDASIDELEHAVAKDLAMTHRILRHINSPLHATKREVSSVRHAISLVGTNQIRQWASVIWLNNIEEKPRELMVMSLIRAHMCQQLAIAENSANADQFFTVGLLSLIDTLFDRPMDVVLKELPLIGAVTSALNHREGVMGEALNCVEAYERCDWECTTFRNLSEKKIREAYLNGVIWSKQMLSELVQ